MSTGLEPEEVAVARENAHAPQERPRDLPGRVCPRCGQKYTGLEVHRSHGREYLYAVHDTWERGKRIRRRCYLGPKDGYRYGVAAQIETTWFGAPLLSSDSQGKFKAYLGYLGNIAWATISAATSTAELGEVLQTLVEAQRAATLKLQTATAPPADQPVVAELGGGE